MFEHPSIASIQLLHDFYTHHRRLDLNNPLIRELGITTSSSRYACDFVIVHEDGEMRTGPGEESHDFLRYGHPVLSPAAGTIVTVVNDIPEREPGFQDVKRDPMIMLGNYVVIDHENGEYSQMGHLIEGSISVRVGDRVSPGQPIARVGNTGASLFPHLHYELVSAPGIRSEGLPAHFVDFDRILGATRVAGDGMPIESGDIVEARSSGGYSATATSRNPASPSRRNAGSPRWLPGSGREPTHGLPAIRR